MYDKDRNDIVGLLLAKDLLFVDPEVFTTFLHVILIFSFLFVSILFII